MHVCIECKLLQICSRTVEAMQNTVRLHFSCQDNIKISSAIDWSVKRKRTSNKKWKKWKRKSEREWVKWKTVIWYLLRWFLSLHVARPAYSFTVIIYYHYSCHRYMHTRVFAFVMDIDRKRVPVAGSMKLDYFRAKFRYAICMLYAYMYSTFSPRLCTSILTGYVLENVFYLFIWLFHSV